MPLLLIKWCWLTFSANQRVQQLSCQWILHPQQPYPCAEWPSSFWSSCLHCNSTRHLQAYVRKKKKIKRKKKHLMCSFSSCICVTWPQINFHLEVGIKSDLFLGSISIIKLHHISLTVISKCGVVHSSHVYGLCQNLGTATELCGLQRKAKE